MKCISIAILLFVCINLNAQDFEYSSKRIKVKKIGEVTPKEHKSSFQPILYNLESPMPDGEGYRDKLQTFKKELRLKYPLKEEPQNFQKAFRSNSVEVLQGFTPNDTNGAILGGTPNDNTLAISNDGLLIAAWNTRIYFYDTENHKHLYKPDPFTRTMSFAQFAMFNDSISTNFPFDPKALYDPINDRFMLVFLSGRDPNDSKNIVAFSSTNNPIDKWNVYEVSGAPLNDSTWTDYPAIAQTEEELFLTVNLLIEGKSWKEGFAETIIWQMNKEDGYAGKDSLETKLWHDIELNGKPVRYMCPIGEGKEPKGPNIYFISNRNYPPLNDSLIFENDTIILVEITNTISSKKAKLDVKMGISSIPYTTPPDARQPNGHFFDTNDGRILGGYYNSEKDVIQYIASTMDTSTRLPAIYHGFINSVTSTPKYEANIISHPTRDLGFPNIMFSSNTNSRDESIIIVNHTSPTDTAGCSFVFYDESGIYSPIVELVKGHSYVDRILQPNRQYERWGDYTGIQRKFNEPGKVWVCGYKGERNLSPTTYIAELQTPVYPVTNIQESSIKESRSTFYPNPVNTHYKARLEFEIFQESRIQINIVDLSGKLVRSIYKGKAKKGKNYFEINTYPLPSGLYTLIIEEDGKIIDSKKFIVKK